MKFDPITGEMINDTPENEVQEQAASKQENMAFDPITGELVSQKTEAVAVEEPAKEEAVVEQPVEQISQPVQEAQPSGGFDPMTGKPLGQASQPSGGFDPMTGKPLGQQAQPSGGFDPMTGKPMEQQAQPEKKKKNIMLPFIGIAVAVVVVLAVGLVVSGAFSGPAGKIRKAATNTFQEMPHLVKDLQGISMLASSEYTLGAKMTMEEESMEAEFRSKASEKQVYAKINLDDIPEMTLLAGVDKSEVKLQVPELLDQVFVYNFKGKNNGYLMEEVDEEELELVNSLLEDLNADTIDAKKFYGELTTVILDEFNALEFEKADKEEYRVDGEKRTCSGYIAEITEDNMINIIDGLEEVVNKYVDEEMNELLEESGESIEDVFDDMRDEFEDMDEIELSFYLYKNMLACVKMENTDTDSIIEIMFKGGDYRIQNIEIVEETEYGEYSYEMKGSTSDSTEKFKFISNGNKDNALEIEYDYKSGDFEIQQDSYSDINIKGNLKGSASKIVIKFEELEYDYDILDGAELEVTLSSSVKMGKFSGKEFDLGNASEDDFEDLADDLEDAIYDNDLEDLMYYF